LWVAHDGLVAVETHRGAFVSQLESEGPPALQRHLQDGEAAVIAGLPD
jgi:hypothetical protein